MFLLCYRIVLSPMISNLEFIEICSPQWASLQSILDIYHSSLKINIRRVYDTTRYWFWKTIFLIHIPCHCLVAHYIFNVFASNQEQVFSVDLVHIISFNAWNSSHKDSMMFWPGFITWHILPPGQWKRNIFTLYNTKSLMLVIRMNNQDTILIEKE